MRTLCTLAIMIAGAGLIAGMPSRYAQACDDDRYPCPVREQAVQETANAPAKPAPQPKKKVNHTRANEEASAKREAAAPANVSEPAMQQQAMQKAAEASLAAVAAAPADDESRGESLVATAATAWPVSPNSEGAGGATAANVVEAASNPAQSIDPKQSNPFPIETSRTAKLAGFPNLHPHCLRHSRGYALADKGIDLRTIQEWLGYPR